MGFHLLNHCFVECIHVKFVKNNGGDKGLSRQVELNVLLEIVERVLIALYQDQVEALLSKEVSVYAASFGTCTIDYCSVCFVADISNL